MNWTDILALLQGNPIVVLLVLAVGFLFKDKLQFFGGGDPIKNLLDGLKSKTASDESEKTALDSLIELLKRDPEKARKIKESL